MRYVRPMNRLADETSPYLQQHAHNPVDWYPWGSEALERAREEGKPIFLSVGYSACHWCHVMERESFEDAEIAAFLNEHFINIKVDREERPDVDKIYMDAVQLMTGQGGWPMSVFLTPELEPFFAGTYFPPEDRWGRPGFMSLLHQLVDIWNTDPEKVERVTSQVTDRLQLLAQTETSDATLDLEPLKGAFRHFHTEFDSLHGGFGGPPKFPPSMQLRLLLHIATDEQRPEAPRDASLDMVEQTLVHMASGGMYDHIGGGFHRYSTDREWLVPHFEKMLYDNALLVAAYTETYQVTGRPFYARIVRESLAYILREMTADAGGFFSSQDADTDGEEGKFFVWTPASLRDAIGADASMVCTYWGIEPGGNFEGESIPNRLYAIDADWTLAFDEEPAHIEALRQRVFEARAERTKPGTDTKVLCAWNGLMISAFARAGAVFGEQDWLDAGRRAADFIDREMRDGDGVFRTHKDGRARFPGYLDDFVCYALGCFDLFEATSQLRWLDVAEQLTDRAIELFWDDDGGAFYYTAEHHTDLIVRQKESFDSATPASNSTAANLLLRLSAATGRTEFRDRADALLRTYYAQMEKAPQSLCEMMQALDMHVSGPTEVVCVTPDGQTSLSNEAWREFRANGIVFDATGDDYAARVPVAQERPAVDGKPTVYVCRDGVCELPVTELG